MRKCKQVFVLLSARVAELLLLGTGAFVLALPRCLVIVLCFDVTADFRPSIASLISFANDIKHLTVIDSSKGMTPRSQNHCYALEYQTDYIQ